MSSSALNITRSTGLTWLTLVASLIAFWPVWTWYFERLSDRSDEPLGLVALAVFLTLNFHRKRNGSQQPGSTEMAGRTATIISLGLVGIYSLLSAWAPTVLLAPFAVLVVGISLFQTRCIVKPNTGDWALLLLSLPLVASLNFYLGFPLRMLSCHIASIMLNLNGMATSVVGAQIISSQHSIGIDEPCSGVKMLWAAVFLAACVASWKRFTIFRTVQISALSVVLAIVANIMRISSLFYLESGRFDFGSNLHSIFHSGIGVASFAISCSVLYFIAQRTGSSSSINASPAVATTPIACTAPIKYTAFGARDLSFLILCIVAATIPILQRPAQAISSNYAFTGWPPTFEGRKFTEVPLSEANEKFASRFPGRIAVFANGNTRIVYRWITEATRQLHASADCYKASGYTIVWLPEYIDTNNNRWAAFEAIKDGERLSVRERISDNFGHGWIDVSSWYWGAVLKETKAPYWCVTVTERIQ